LAILTSAIVLEARERHADGETLTELARRFGTSLPQMHKVLTRKVFAVLPEERLCGECGKPGIEPSRSNGKKFHAACAHVRELRLARESPEAVARKRAGNSRRTAAERAARYEADPVYRERIDASRVQSLGDRPYLEALSWQVIWTRYRLREGEFLRLLAWQQELCPCGAPFTGRPSVDHDHSCCPSVAIGNSCGRCIRGLLHGTCNRLLGVIENNLDVIEPQGWVAKYLADPPYRQMQCWVTTG
jgi:hypothetical protein